MTDIIYSELVLVVKNLNSSGKPRTFLATTALDDFWDKTQPILFLGEWCTQYKNKHIWEKLDCETLDGVFEEQTQEKICEFVDNVLIEILSELAPCLNKIHKIEYPPIYWEILLGPFLFYHIKTTYDRYCRIKKAFSLFPNLKTIGPIGDVHIIPINGDDYYTMANSNDVWNHQFSVQIIRKLYPQALQPKDKNSYVYQSRAEKINNYKNGQNQYRFVTSVIIHFLWILVKLRGKKCAVFSSNTPFSKKNRLLLMLASCFKIIPIEPLFPSVDEYTQLVTDSDYTLRNQITDIKVKNTFSKLVLDLLVVHMPLSFIENYQILCRVSEKKYPFFAKIFIGMGLLDEETRLFAAKGRLFNKTTNVGIQHSGSYGVVRLSDEFLEHRFVDYFLEWGTKNDKKIIGLPVVAFCQKRQLSKKSLIKYPILWITTEFIRYAPEIDQAIDGKYDEKLFLWNSQMLNLLDSEVCSKITVRLRHSNYSDNWKFLKNQFPLLKIHKPDNKSSFYDMICETNLLLIDNLQSTFFYGLGYNIPTIIFCDEAIYKVRESAQYYFELLSEAGIYHKTPASAAKMINEVWENPSAWWMTDKVQSARKAFCDYFIKNSTFWLLHWKKELTSLL